MLILKKKKKKKKKKEFTVILYLYILLLIKRVHKLLLRWSNPVLDRYGSIPLGETSHRYPSPPLRGWHYSAVWLTLPLACVHDFGFEPWRFGLAR